MSQNTGQPSGDSSEGADRVPDEAADTPETPAGEADPGEEAADEADAALRKIVAEAVGEAMRPRLKKVNGELANRRRGQRDSLKRLGRQGDVDADEGAD